MAKFVEFIKGSYAEFTTQVEWPKWNELVSSTLVVAVASLLIAVATYLVDETFRKSLEFLFR